MLVDEKILEAAAKAVTGFDITVRHRTPAIKHTWGACHQSPTGKRFIDVNPFVPQSEYFHVFLHECGHWKVSQGELKRSDYHERMPLTEERTEPANAELHELEEKYCEALAERWDAWAEANADATEYFKFNELAKARVLAEKYQTT